MLITLCSILPKCRLLTATKLLSPFLTDRTNGRAYATVLRLSVVVSSV